MIVWDESMSTGDSRLDAQHRMLFQKFNEFSEIVERRVDVREAAGEVLDFLQFYAIWHFGQEEECMHKHQCPVAAANKNAHEEYKKMFGEFYLRWQENTMDLTLALETHDRLAEWIRRHVISTDTRLRPCLPQTEPRTDSAQPASQNP